MPRINAPTYLEYYKRSRNEVVKTLKQAQKYLNEFPAGYPTHPVKIGKHETYWTFSNGFGPPFTRHTKTPNGRRVTANYFNGHKAPMSIGEECPNGTIIRTSFPGDWAAKNGGTTTQIETPSGNMYYRLRKPDGTIKYSMYNRNSMDPVEGSQEYLKAMFENNLNAARKGYA